MRISNLDPGNLEPRNFALDNCLKCSLCNTACPVYAVHPQYPGPKHLGPELERLRRETGSVDSPWLEYCLGCHRCDLVCPHQVDVSEMIARAKAAHRKPLVRALRDWWFARPGLLGRLTTILPALSNLALSLAPARFLMSKLMRITPLRKFPAYTRPNLCSPAIAPNQPRVVFFPGCFIRYNRPDLGRTIVELLQRNGIATQIAATDCCGVPAIANGDATQALSLARANVRILSSQAAEGVRIVTACSSCGHMLKTAFAAQLQADPEFAAAAQQIAAATLDLGELLMQLSDAGQLDTRFHPNQLRLAYHAPCHPESQGIGRPWFHLLSQIPGVSVQDLDAGCCGMSGTFGFKEEKYPVSMAIGQQLFNRIHETQPQLVATECATCQMQIEHGTALKSIHPAELLLQAYGAPFEAPPPPNSRRTR